MGDFSHYLTNKLLNQVFGSESFLPPHIFYLGVSTTTVNDDGSGITEPSDSSYARIAIPNNKIFWSGSTVLGGMSQLKNLVEIEFATSTIVWGDIISWFLSDSALGGNVYAYGDLSPAIYINVGNKLIIPSNGITFTLD